MQKKLERDEQNKMIAGVAAGVAEYLNVEVTWIRVLFLLLAIFGLSGVWIYLILWIAVPAKPFLFSNMGTDYKVKEDFTSTTSDFNPPDIKKSGSGRVIAGVFLVLIGFYFLLDQFMILPEWFSVEKLWPVFFIFIGLVILLKPSKKQASGTPYSKDNTPADGGQNTDDGSLA